MSSVKTLQPHRLRFGERSLFITTPGHFFPPAVTLITMAPCSLPAKSADMHWVCRFTSRGPSERCRFVRRRLKGLSAIGGLMRTLIVIADRDNSLTSASIWSLRSVSSNFLHLSQSLLQITNLCFQGRNESFQVFKLVLWY